MTKMKMKMDLGLVGQNGDRIQIMLPPILTGEEIKKLKEILSHSDPPFYIVATRDFQYALSKGEHSIIRRMNEWMKKVLLEGNGIRISKELILKWIEGKLDPMNAFVLSNCEIRVEMQGGILSTGDSKND